jgi:hypothetical protein
VLVLAHNELASLACCAAALQHSQSQASGARNANAKAWGAEWPPNLNSLLPKALRGGQRFAESVKNPATLGLSMDQVWEVLAAEAAPANTSAVCSLLCSLNRSDLQQLVRQGKHLPPGFRARQQQQQQNQAQSRAAAQQSSTSRSSQHAPLQVTPAASGASGTPSTPPASGPSDREAAVVSPSRTWQEGLAHLQQQQQAQAMTVERYMALLGLGGGASDDEEEDEA